MLKQYIKEYAHYELHNIASEYPEKAEALKQLMETIVNDGGSRPGFVKK